MSALLPPPAASENRSTKNKIGCGVRSWDALITRTFRVCHCFIGNGTVQLRVAICLLAYPDSH
ncbi:hypothetical protein XCR_3972 [Xanthomonas campestris pv. raphani 756C]|nr:hypothetical protein XCR_3972 [Xanthomonas campestris pv. raphani 756C]